MSNALNKKAIFLTILGILVLVLAAAVVLALRTNKGKGSWVCQNGEWVKRGKPTNPMPNEPCNGEKITNFEECAKAGYPIFESYPRRCQTPDGTTFTEDIGNELEKQDLIKINNPRPNQLISSPLTITGQAKGYWFFEADFPIKLLDIENNIIATAIARAQDEWMTEDFVPFLAELEFKIPASDRGVLIFKKDNPSGLPEYDDELVVPIYFRQP